MKEIWRHIVCMLASHRTLQLKATLTSNCNLWQSKCTNDWVGKTLNKIWGRMSFGHCIASHNWACYHRVTYLTFWTTWENRGLKENRIKTASRPSCTAEVPLIKTHKTAHRSSGAAEWPTVEDCGCTGKPPDMLLPWIHLTLWIWNRELQEKSMITWHE